MYKRFFYDYMYDRTVSEVRGKFRLCSDKDGCQGVIILRRRPNFRFESILKNSVFHFD